MQRSTRTTIREILIASLAVVTTGAPTWASHDEPIVCSTEDIWEKKRVELGLSARGTASCTGAGVCDDPLIRDGASQTVVTIPTIVHVMRSANGVAPNGVDPTAVDLAMAELNLAFSPYGIAFVHEIRVHDDGDYYCIPAFSPYDLAWYFAIRDMKVEYAESPGTRMNLFVSCQDGTGPTLGGIGTFPWDPEALTAYGGLWVNSLVFGGAQGIVAHEVGHNLGLWHTHHGVEEVDGCTDACYEEPHASSDSAADLVGDFCADTPATPLNFACADPSGGSCAGTPWPAYGPTAFTNYMGYAYSCYDHFTPQQSARAHCWIRSVLGGWAGVDDCNIPPNPVYTITATPVTHTRINLAWSDLSSNVGTFRIERDSGTGYVEIASVPGFQRSYADQGLDCETSHSYRVTAENCGGVTDPSSVASATTLPCPAGTLMHVEDVAVTTTKKGARVRGEGTVLIEDQLGAPVAGVRVIASWDGPVFFKQTAYTGSNGVASFQTEYLHASSYCFSLDVSSVDLDGATYYPNENVETSDEAGNACGAP